MVGLGLDRRDPVLSEVLEAGMAVVAVSPGGLLAGADVVLPSYGSTAAVPVQSNGRVIGIVVALRLLGAEPFQPGELPLLVSFAEQATLALELGEKSRAARQLDMLADRDRIARDLHDHVIQRLFATGLQLQSVLGGSTDPEVQRSVRQAVADLDVTVREIRMAIFDLHTTSEEARTSLRRWVLDTASEAAHGSEVLPSVRMTGAVDTLVSPDVGVHAVAVVREAVSNAVRHARASNIVVAVEANDHLLVEVTDDGVGIDSDAPRSGLDNLAWRARECGGELVVGAEPLGGTRLSWRVPLG